MPSVFRGTLGKQCGPMNPHRAHTIFFGLFSSIFPPVGLIHTRGPPQSSRGPYPHHPSAPSYPSPLLSNPSAHALFSGGGDVRSPAPSSSGCGARGPASSSGGRRWRGAAAAAGVGRETVGVGIFFYLFNFFFAEC